MGIFGNSLLRKPMLSRELMAAQQPPMMSRELMAQQQDRMPSMGYDRNAAMMGQSGFAPMNQAMPQKKPGFFSKGGAFFDVLGAFGDAFSENGPVYAQQKAQRSRLMQEAQMAEQKRMQDREDFLWRQQNENRAPYRWESNDGSLMEIGPDGQPRQVYKDPNKKPEYRQGPDGRFYRVDIAEGPLPTFTADDWEKGQPVGGSVGNGTGGFR